MRRDIVLAVAVLSVLAGLLAVGYAQNRTEDEPDAFELRRTLIDRIEDAYTRGDVGTLDRLTTVEQQRQRVLSVTGADLAARLQAVVDQLSQASQGAENDGLQSVQSAVSGSDLEQAFDWLADMLTVMCVWEKIGSPFSGVLTCSEKRQDCINEAYAYETTPPDKLLIDRLLCENRFHRCENEEQQAVDECETLWGGSYG